MKYRFIFENRGLFFIGKMCKALEVSRSGYHNYVRRKMSQRRYENMLLEAEIREIYETKRGRYGSPRIWKELRKRGKRVNRKRVERIMRVNNFAAHAKRKYKVTTNSKHNKPVAENLLNQNFKTDSPNKIWVSDITYIWTTEGWLYLCVILDLFSRRVVGWSMNQRVKADLVIAAMKQALINRNSEAGLIFHSDRGSQYASNAVQSLLKENSFIQSMSRKGNCYDNAVAESFFNTLKTELVYNCNFSTRLEAQNYIFDYIEIFYNRQRMHSYLNYLTPVEFENLNIKLVA
jgi:putative transposase